MPASHDDEDFATDRVTQEAGVDLIASVIDGVLRARNPDTAQVPQPCLCGAMVLSSSLKDSEGTRETNCGCFTFG